MRRPANSRRDKKSFTRNASRVHGVNLRGKPMRGGFRL